MKALGLAVSDKKIFVKFILKTYLLTPWPSYAANWNSLNNFDRGPPRDHSFEVWSKSNKRRCCLKKLLTDGRTHARTTGIEGSQKLTWALRVKNNNVENIRPKQNHNPLAYRVLTQNSVLVHLHTYSIFICVLGVQVDI